MAIVKLHPIMLLLATQHTNQQITTIPAQASTLQRVKLKTNRIYLNQTFYLDTHHNKIFIQLNLNIMHY
jgi:hypothetical protein